MGIVKSVANSVLFPAPPSSYDETLTNLIWIPKRFGRRDHRDSSRKMLGAFPALYLPSPKPSTIIAIYLHGNSCDIGQIKPELRLLCYELNISIMAVEYPGFGILPEVSVPTGPDIDFRVRATFHFLLSIGIDPSSIIFFGRSIGTGPAAHMAAYFKQQGIQCGGVILQAPFISVHKIVQDYIAIGSWFIDDMWNTAESLKILEPDMPLLIIHGIIDEIVSVEHGRTLFDMYKSKNKMADFQPNSKHNIYSIMEDLVIPINKFLTKFVYNDTRKIIDTSLPEWCLYNCKGLVNSHMKNKITKGHISSRLISTDSMYSRITTERSDKTQEKEDELEKVEEEVEKVEAQEVGEVEDMGKPIHRNIENNVFTSSLKDLCERNSINQEDITEIVEEAISRNSSERSNL